MDPTIIDITDNYLQRIANVLLLNSSFIDNVGLLNGKTGISIFFYHYSRYTKNQIYEEYGGELIDEIYEEIHQHSTVDYINGLAGFGTGIEYLVNNCFIEADTDDVLVELDQQIQHNVIHHTPRNIDLSFWNFRYW